MEKLLSIIIPVYNGEKFISKMLNSLLPQINKEIEIIVINDGSTDNTGNIMKKYSTNENIIYVSQRNKGVSEARNKGIEISTGKYITFADCDDIYSKRFVKTISQCLKKDYQLIIFNICSVKNMKKATKITNSKKGIVKLGKNPGIIGYLENDFSYKYGNNPVNKIYSADIIKKNGIKFIKDKRIGEDFLFNIEYFENVSSILCLNSVLYYYIYHNESAVRKYKTWLVKEYFKYNEYIPQICEKYDYHNYKNKLAKLYLKETKQITANEAKGTDKKIAYSNLKKFFEEPMFIEEFYKIKISTLNFRMLIFYIIVRYKLYYMFYHILKLCYGLKRIKK